MKLNKTQQAIRLLLKVIHFESIKRQQKDLKIFDEETLGITIFKINFFEIENLIYEYQD